MTAYFSVQAEIGGVPVTTQRDLSAALLKRRAQTVRFVPLPGCAEIPEDRGDKLGGWLGHSVLLVYAPDKDVDRVCVGTVRLRNGRVNVGD
jgi:hypothetical protein